MEQFRFVTVAAKWKKLLIAALAVLLLVACWGAQEALCGARSMLARAETSDSVWMTTSGPGIQYVPKNHTATYLKVISWLRLAKPYEGTVAQEPSGAYSISVGFAAVGLSAGKHYVRITPAVFLTGNENGDVLAVQEDGKTSYIRSAGLCRWLKSDQWEKECRLFTRADWIGPA